MNIEISLPEGIEVEVLEELDEEMMKAFHVDSQLHSVVFTPGMDLYIAKQIVKLLDPEQVSSETWGTTDNGIRVAVIFDKDGEPIGVALEPKGEQRLFRPLLSFYLDNPINDLLRSVVNLNEMALNQ